ncbi:ABC transporter ATP-binding protein [Corynebacterium choanae]|uniref:Daunorubicin/doxorubicin resistance ATP-binding protein DrrA n=1 Tax=Corynebacterium choanae TaxID=1862358 RepID=A0A3G6J7T9_9CORY|nr:ABC transporter ATP-binding protein [Corynebacterium choanae]AZA14056.1 Daunorubicin/doxorubicin resistance ATP-binding protein DrrA [Corynebacterium choanae]
MTGNIDPGSPVLVWDQVSKQFGDKLAVSKLSLSIPRGSFFGIVGPNGAGKTTAITIACGLLEPDSGRVFLHGHDVWNGGDIAAKQSYGLLADGLEVFDRLTGEEYLSYLGRLRGLDEATIAARSGSLLGALGLNDAASKMIVDYSAGMRKKILLAGAMLHRPQLLVLDEPLEAVDPVSADTIKKILHRFVAGGGTVVISSHVMELVETICDHVALIADGQVAVAGTLDEVRQGRTLAQTFVDTVGAGALEEQTLDWLDKSANGHDQSPSAGRVLPQTHTRGTDE